MDARVTRVIDLMERTIDSDCSVAALAADVNLSTSRLTELFRRDVGTTPARFLRALRMERARQLLERTFLTVKEVMAFVGVNDPSHFTREFSRHHGLAPTRLRQRSWAAEYQRPDASAPTKTRNGQ